MNELPLPPPPRRGSFWHLGGERDIWTIGVKLLVWGSLFALAAYFIFTS